MSNPFNDDESGLEMIGASGGSSIFPGSEDFAGGTGAPGRKLEDRNNVITARGTSEGLVLRVDGRVETEDLLSAVREFLESRRSFLSGNDVAFEWVGQRPEEAVVQSITAMLLNDFSVSVRASNSVRASKQKAVATPKKAVQETVSGSEFIAPKEAATIATLGSAKTTPFKRPGTMVDRNVSLFDGIESLDSRPGASNPLAWDEPDARIIYGTLRSGQKVETEHSIIIFGDVNSGAEIIAGGDVVILGTLRGIAHAGAYDETGGGRVIFSLNLRPTQLRIGLVISRGSGSDEAESTPRGGLPEVARVDGNMIVVEPYQSRTVWGRRRE
jgi:septum formation inhibitor MinC